MRAKTKLLDLLAVLDTEQTGKLTLQDLLNGYDEHYEMQLVLDEMNIYKEDLSQAYSHLCEDELGEVKYTQLVDQLQHLKHHDSHTMLLIIRHCLKDLQDEIQLHVENKLVEHLEKTDRMMDMLTEMHAQRNWIFPSELNKVSAA